MTEPNIFDQLYKLDAMQQDARKRLEAKQEELQQRRHSVQQQMLALQAELDTLSFALQALPSARQEVEQQFVEEEVELLSSTLQAVQSAIGPSLHQQDEWRALDNQIALLLNTQQGLAEKWRAYGEFEEKRDQYAALLPAFHYAELLESHAKLARELAPLRNLEEDRQKLAAPAPVELTCLCLYSKESIELALVMPIFAGDLWDVADGEGNPWGQLANFVSKALFDVAKQPAWEIDGTEPKGWATFLALYSLVDYEGTEPPLQELSNLLQRYSDLHVEEAPSPIQWQLVPLSLAAWQARSTEIVAKNITENITEVTPESTPATDESVEHDPADRDEEASAASAEIAADGDEVVEVEAGGWYSADDLTSWQRTLKVSSERKWTRSGRQIRTLLTRMVAKGLIEEHYVPATQLWAGLPLKVARTMEAHSNRLVDSEVLLVQDSAAGERAVTLNPALLDETQNLINRTVTRFWEPLVVDEQ